MKTAMTKGYEAYKSSNPDNSEYMEDGYQSARGRNPGQGLRERAAIAAMQGLLANGSNNSIEFIAERSVYYADALIKELKETKQ